MWYLSNGVLCSHHMTKNTLVHICNTHNGVSCIQFCLHSGLHQVDNLVQVDDLIAITIILPFLMCHRNVQLGDAVSATVGSRVVVQTVESRATRGGRQVAWMHTTWGHFMMEHLQIKCAQWVTLHHRKQREIFVNFLLTCPFWLKDRCLLDEQLTIFQLHDRCQTL